MGLSQWLILSGLCLMLHILASPGKVKAEQHFIEKPRSMRVFEGSTALMKCVIGDRKGMVQWTKGGNSLGFNRTIPGKPRYHMVGDLTGLRDEFNFRILDVQQADDDEYTCQVLSAGGDGYLIAKATITVLTLTWPPPAHPDKTLPAINFIQATPPLNAPSVKTVLGERIPRITPSWTRAPPVSPYTHNPVIIMSGMSVVKLLRHTPPKLIFDGTATPSAARAASATTNEPVKTRPSDTTVVPSASTAKLPAATVSSFTSLPFSTTMPPAIQMSPAASMSLDTTAQARAAMPPETSTSSDSNVLFNTDLFLHSEERSDANRPSFKKPRQSTNTTSIPTHNTTQMSEKSINFIARGVDSKIIDREKSKLYVRILISLNVAVFIIVIILNIVFYFKSKETTNY